MPPREALPPVLPWARPLILLSPAPLLALVGVELGGSPLRMLALGALLLPLFRVPTLFRSALPSLIAGSILGVACGAFLGLVSARHGSDGFFIGLSLGASLGAGWGVVSAQLALGQFHRLLDANARALASLLGLSAGVAVLLRVLGSFAGHATSPGLTGLLLAMVTLAACLLRWSLRWQGWWSRQAAALTPWTATDWPPDAPIAFPERAPIGSPRWWPTLFLEHRASAPILALMQHPTQGSYRRVEEPPRLLALVFSEPTSVGARWFEASLLVAYAMAAALFIAGIGSFGLAVVTLVVFSGASTY